ncbi:MAG: dTMP kinase [Acidimicrobiales bacterium]
MTKRGRFIVLEGWEASGKSTQAKLLAEALGALQTFEPGASRIGKEIREVLLHTGHDLTDRAEALLFAADRAQHVAEIIEPALVRGQDVVCDRYFYSSVAYQGAGRELGVDKILELSAFATAGLTPDLVILLTLPDDVADSRLGSERDLIESGDQSFHARVRACFAQMAADDPTRWVTLDASGDPAEVFSRLSGVVSAKFDVTSHN